MNSSFRLGAATTSFTARLTARTLVALAFAAAGAGAQVVGVAPTYVGAGGAGEEECSVGDQYVCGCGKAHALRARFAAGLPIGEMPGGGQGYGAREAYGASDLLTCDLDIEINPTNQVIAGVCVMRVRSMVAGLTQFTIMLRTQYAVSGATINGSTPVSVPSPAAGSYSRTITLDRSYGLGEEFTLRIPYSGTAVSRGFGSIEFGTQPNSSNVIVASLSQAYFAATWWPCKDGDVFSAGDNSDKFTMRMAITAPAALTSVANGPVESVQTLSGNRRKFTYSSNYPIATYLVAFASSVYNVWSINHTYTPDGGGASRTMPLRFYIYPGSDTTGNRAAWGRVDQMLTTFRPLFGLYPFIEEQYGIYQFPFGGGMEHQTMSGQGTFDEGVTAHELAHQWWGDSVTCKTWNHIWLNEGFATYSEALWAQYKPGSSGNNALQSSILARKPTDPGDSVYVVAVNDMNRVFSSAYSYRKGAWVLHQLRRVVGEQNFFNGLVAYRSVFEGSAVTTEDFSASMSATSGIDLTNFFEQQVYGVGAPDYAVGFEAVTLGGRPYARVSLRQTQRSTWPGRGTPGDAFALPVDLRFTTNGGDLLATVVNNARLEHYLIPLPGTASGVVVDPNNWILNYAKLSAAYIPGPAKVISTVPASGVVLAGSPASLVVAFSDSVTSTAGAYSLVGPSGAISFTHGYDSLGMVATLTPVAALAPGQYTLTAIAASLTTISTGIALDGELVSQPLLPSGDGQGGGNFQLIFEVEAPACAADFNADGGVDGGDVEAFFIAWQGAEPVADVNADGGVDGHDVESFFLVWSVGGC